MTTNQVWLGISHPKCHIHSDTRHSGTEPVDDGGGVALVLRQARHADVGEADFSAERPTGMDLRLSCNLPFIAPAIDNEPYVQ